LFLFLLFLLLFFGLVICFLVGLCFGWLEMSSDSEDKRRKQKKKERKLEKQEKKKEKKRRRRDEDEGLRAATPSVPAVVVVEKVAGPPPDLSKLSAEEKRKLISAGRGARKAAYAGTELAGPQQAKFKKFLRIEGGGDDHGGYDPTHGTPTPQDGEKLEAQLEQQFNKALKYQFGGGSTANQRRGLGSK
jgi:hypothetical protein